MSNYIERLQDRSPRPDPQQRVLALAEDDAEEVLSALGSDTSRRLYRSLFEEPATPSELAADHDQSIQNIHYHLTNLQEAGLITEVGSAYSEKGNEMTIYGPATDPLVLVGEPERIPSIDRSLKHVMAGVGLLGIASLFVQWGAERLLQTTGSRPAAEPARLLSVAGEPSGTLSWLVFSVLEPGLVFFVGCLVVAVVVTVLIE
ncbi:MAG: ArsR/SmtB family transcription factor [Halobacteriales archaeon]